MGAIFYIAAELWGSMGISLLFWQFANQTTRTFEARRFYSSYAQLGNLALIASGVTIVFLSDIRESVPAGVDAWGVTLKYLSVSVGLGCDNYGNILLDTEKCFNRSKIL